MPTWSVRASYPEPVDTAALSCPTATTCFAVGSTTILATTDAGAHWARQSVPDGVLDLSGVSCASTDQCVAVGESSASNTDAVVLATSNGGSTWTSEPIPDTLSSVSGVSCPSTSDCVAVGTGQTLEYGTFYGEVIVSQNGGTTWTEQTSVSALADVSGLNGVSCASPTHCMAFGDDQPEDSSSDIPVIIATTDGSTWTSQTVPTGISYLSSVSCPTASNCTATGDSVTISPLAVQGYVITTSDGGGLWTDQTLPSSSDVPIGLDCSSSLDCTLVGVTVDATDVSELESSPGNSFILDTTDGGTNWTPQTNPAPTSELLAVSCASASACLVGGEATMLGTTTGGSAWSVQPVPSGVGITSSVSCGSTTTCAAVGAGSLLRSTNSGSSWTVEPLPNASWSLSAVSCVSASRCVAVGSGNGVPASLVTADGGTSWTSSTIGSGSFAGASVSCASAADCVVVGIVIDEASSPPFKPAAFTTSNGGASWKASSVPNSAGVGLLESVSCPTTSQCVAVGPSVGATTPGTESLVLVSSDGGATWSSAPAPPDLLDAVSCGSATDCVTIGELHAFVSVDGGLTWYSYDLPNQLDGTVTGISCTNAADCVAVTGGGGSRSASGGSSGETTTVIPAYALATTDGGQSWTSTSIDPTVAGLLSVACPSTSLCVAAGENPGDGAVVTASDDPFADPSPILFGYHLVGSDGSVFPFGTAEGLGSMAGKPLNKPVVGMATTPDGHGYWLVASDGGIFSFGAAAFHGSTGSLTLNKPIAGIAGTPDGGGYWLVASDGGIFAFGDAGFYGSTGSLTLNKPAVGMASTPDGHGYWLVASDGGIFAFGDAPFLGSKGGSSLAGPIVGMTGG